MHRARRPARGVRRPTAAREMRARRAPRRQLSAARRHTLSPPPNEGLAARGVLTGPTGIPPLAGTRPPRVAVRPPPPWVRRPPAHRDRRHALHGRRRAEPASCGDDAGKTRDADDHPPHAAAHRREGTHARRAARRARDRRRPARDRRLLLPGVRGSRRDQRREGGPPRGTPRGRALRRRRARVRRDGRRRPARDRSWPLDDGQGVVSATASASCLTDAIAGETWSVPGPGAPLAAYVPNATCSRRTRASCPPGRGRGSHANHPFGESPRAGAPPIRQQSVPSPPSKRSVPCGS